MTDQRSTYKLSNGVEIPCIGFGMWQTPDDEVGVDSKSEAHGEPDPSLPR